MSQEIAEQLRHYAGTSCSLRFLDSAAEQVEQRDRLLNALKDATCQILDLTGNKTAVSRFDELIHELESGDG